MAQSPFQVLSTIEARAVLGLDPAASELVLILPNEIRGRIQCDRIARATEWGSRVDVEHDAGRFSRARRVASTRRLAADRSVEAVAIGEYRSPLMLHLANTAASRGGEVFLVDDGVGTLLVRDLRAGAAVDAPNYRRRRAEQVMRAVVPLRQGAPEKLRFVTGYDISVAPPDTVLRHDYAWTRSQRREIPSSTDPMFVGTSLVESGSLDPAWYERHVVAVCSQYGSRYVPHRREADAKLERLRAAGVAVTPLDGPVEFELNVSGWAPARVDTLFSTVLHTLPRLLDVPIHASRPPPSAVVASWVPRLDSLYTTLAQHAPSVRVTDSAVP